MSFFIYNFFLSLLRHLVPRPPCQQPSWSRTQTHACKPTCVWTPYFTCTHAHSCTHTNRNVYYTVAIKLTWCIEIYSWLASKWWSNLKEPLHVFLNVSLCLVCEAFVQWTIFFCCCFVLYRCHISLPLLYICITNSWCEVCPHRPKKRILFYFVKGMNSLTCH